MITARSLLAMVRTIGLLVLVGPLLLACSWAWPIWSIRLKGADPMYRFEVNGKVGFLNERAEVVIEPMLDAERLSIAEFHDGRLRDEERQGFMDQTGKLVLRVPNDRWGGIFSEGLLKSREYKGGPYGFRDIQGNFVIPPIFPGEWDHVLEHFSEGRAVAGTRDRVGYIDRSGKFVIPASFVHAEAFSEGFAKVVVDGPCFYRTQDDPCSSGFSVPNSPGGRRDRPPVCQIQFVNREGSFLPGTFPAARDFAEGLAAAVMGERWGYIDTSGSWRIAAEFSAARSFSDGRAAVSTSGDRYGYIDKTGATVIPHLYRRADQFSDGRAVVHLEYDAPAFYIDAHGKPAFEGKFENAGAFYKGLAHVEFLPKDRDPEIRTHGYIDTSGKVLFTYGKSGYRRLK